MFLSGATLGTASQVITSTPALLLGVVVHSLDATGTVEIYDGINTVNGVKKIDLQSPSGTDFAYPFFHPVRFDKGIYVNVIATIDNYTILWVPQEQPVRSS